VAGIGLLGLGGLLVLAGLGSFPLRLGTITPAVLAVLGATFLASGLSRRS
jgi:hypothetical protein